MMNMVLVRFERALATANTNHHHTDHIERRDNQRTESNHESTFGIRGDIRIVLAVFDGKEREHIAQSQAARITHKNLTGTFRTAEDVIVKERDQHTERGKGEHAVRPKFFLHEQEAKDKQGNAAQTGGKTVDTVNQIDGIGDKDNQKNRKRHTYPGRKGIQAEKTVEVIDPKAGQGKKRSTDDLDHKFLTVAHSDKVIGNTRQVEQSHPADQKQALGQQVHRTEGGNIITHQDAKGEHATGGKQDGGEERDTAQTGNGTFMNLALTRHIEKLLPQRDKQDAGNDKPGNRSRDDKSQYDEKDIQDKGDLGYIQCCVEKEKSLLLYFPVGIRILFKTAELFGNLTFIAGKGTLSPAVDDAMRLTGEVVVKDFTIAISQKAHLQQGSGQAVEHFPTTVQDLLDADFLVTVIVDRRVITHQKRKAQTGFFLVGGAMMGI